MTTPIPQSVDTLASGRTTTAPFITAIKDRAPTGNDGINGQYQVGQRWIDSSMSNAEYFLLNFVSSNGVVQANWILLESGLSTVETLTGNTGTAVTPDGSNNINVVGDGTTGLLFNGASHTLTGTLNNIPNSALANSTITLNAGNGISITGSPISLGGAATISATAMVPTSFTTDVGVATPVLNNLNVFGSGGISTTGIGNTIAINGGGIVDSLVFDADTGTASPSSGTIIMQGAGGVTTSASGNTVTFTGSGSGGGFTSIVYQVFTSSGTYTPTAGTVYAIVECVGGGGGGGGADVTSATTISCGAGGGGGGYAKSTYPVATITGQTVTIGAGGSGGVGKNAGNNGSSTSLGTLVVAGGGLGGAASDTSTSNHSGGGGAGTGTTGQILLSGSPGSPGYGSGNTSNGGTGGSSIMGGGGRAATSNGNGTVGGNYGGGGGGAASEVGGIARNGGAGANGVVIITQYLA